MKSLVLNCVEKTSEKGTKYYAIACVTPNHDRTRLLFPERSFVSENVYKAFKGCGIYDVVYAPDGIESIAFLKPVEL